MYAVQVGPTWVPPGGLALVHTGARRCRSDVAVHDGCPKEAGSGPFRVGPRQLRSHFGSRSRAVVHSVYTTVFLSADEFITFPLQVSLKTLSEKKRTASWYQPTNFDLDYNRYWKRTKNRWSILICCCFCFIEVFDF